MTIKNYERILMSLFAFFCLIKIAEAQNIVAEFRFVAGNDMFFKPWNGNGDNLQRLADFIAMHKEMIDTGRAKVYVTGYCDGSGNKAERLACAKIMSNRVKSELIRYHGWNALAEGGNNDPTSIYYTLFRFIPGDPFTVMPLLELTTSAVNK